MGHADRRVFEINTIFEQKRVDRDFPDNRVKTTKYSCLTFFPANLMLQFSKLANAYFLIMVVLQAIPRIAPDESAAIMTLMPLCFVVGISMIKDGYEDYQRNKQDEADNKAAC